MAPQRQRNSSRRLSRGFFLFTLVRRLFWLAVFVWAGKQLIAHKEQVMPWVVAASAKVQAMLPKQGASTQADKIAQGYSALRNDTIVSLYRAAHAFSEAAQASEHDVQARAAQADAEVALAHAYGMSADLLAQRGKVLKGAPRRASERLAKEERREAHKHVQRGQQFAKEALRLSPVAFTAQRAMAGALLEGGRTERAKPYLAQAKAACPEDPATLVLLADQLSDAAPKDAVALLHQVLAQEPHYNAAHLRLALLFRRLDIRRGARQEILAILEANPEHDLARSMLLQLEPMATRARADGSGHALPREHEVLQILRLEEGGTQAPQETVPDNPGPGLSLSPGVQAWLAWGEQTATKTAAWLKTEATMRLKASEQAIERSLADAAPPPAPATPAARAAMPPVVPAPQRDAPQSAPKAAPPAVAQASGPAKVAQGPAQTARRAIPTTDYAGAVAAAKSLQESRDNTGAEAMWRQALALRKDSVEAAMGVGWCRLQAQDGSTSEASFRAVLRQAPRNTEAWFGVAEALRLQGKTMDAQAAYRQYLMIEPAGPLAPLCHRMLEALSH